jgi:hypothetical protein
VSLLQVLRDPQPERLQEAIQLAGSTLAVRLGGDRTPPPWYLEARAALDHASEACEARQLERGWALVHRARELEVLAFANADVTAEATTLAAEISSPWFGGWRREAIADHLGQVLAKGTDGRWALPLAERRTWLLQALRTRDEGFSNQYRNLALVRRYQAILLLAALGILVCALVGAAFANPEFGGGVETWWAALGAALSGALGGIASALQRITRRNGERIPERLGSLVASLSRPVIGGIAGVTVFLAVRAGITQTNEQQVAYLLLVSFGAGFAERLVVRDPREEVAERGGPHTLARAGAMGAVGVADAGLAGQPVGVLDLDALAAPAPLAAAGVGGDGSGGDDTRGFVAAVRPFDASEGAAAGARDDGRALSLGALGDDPAASAPLGARGLPG